MPVTIAEEWLSACSGCEIAILNLGETLLEILPEVEFVHIPVLMDHKYYGPTGEGTQLEIPEAAVGIVSGGVRNEEHLEVLETMRRRCDVLVALGTCATHGGIPSLINEFTNNELLERYYRTTETTDPTDPPGEGIPALLDRTYALDEKVKVDHYLPGCPPHPDHIGALLSALLRGESPVLPEKSVCDTCPTRREGKGAVRVIRRFLENASYDPETPLSDMRCLLEQGLLCMGPVTRAGCAGSGGEAPRCIVARVPCRGCYGPVRPNGNQRLDMLNALASNGIDFKDLPDRQSLLRFSGAHGRLRPIIRHMTTRKQ
ncbi:MAG: methyl viologen-reducing hydrogenase [Thermodesulfobacteriota bacterium]|nr:methyl viologen-reducing hydrogenase [Thermodesulfobacteriota bacterium]